ncbi:MAG: hypothetical protein M3R25_07210 [Bacteroidota bacterium]|nr:hypothetical protein [Bacteroidota bacterium]
MQIYILILSLALFSFSCKNSKVDNADHFTEMLTAQPSNTFEKSFDADKWKINDGKNYPHRERLYPHLLASDSLRDLKKEAVLDWLGKPDRIDSNFLFYNISQQRIAAFPLHTRILVIELGTSGARNKILLYE